MEGGKEQRNVRLHAKDFKKKQKYHEVLRTVHVVQQQPLPHQEDSTLPQDHDEEFTGEDFRDLVSRTATGGGLVLKAERDWNKDITLGSGSEQFSHFFDLDVQQLANAISTIPFHERFDLSDVPLTTGLKEKFNGDALEKLKSFKSGSKETHKETFSNNSETTLRPAKEFPLQIDDEPEVIPPDSVIVDTKEDIQGWLDDVLDL